MKSTSLFLYTADFLLLIHLMFVAFIVFGLILIFLGKIFQWRWVRNPWFRIVHLLAIAIVVVQSWIGILCPLTTWEMALRERTGGTIYSESFVEHWFGKILYYQAPPWVFTLCYTIFGGIVIASWFWVKPRRFVRHP